MSKATSPGVYHQTLDNLQQSLLCDLSGRGVNKSFLFFYYSTLIFPRVEWTIALTVGDNLKCLVDDVMIVQQGLVGEVFISSVSVVSFDQEEIETS